MKKNDFNSTRHTLIQRLKDWNDQAGWEEFFNIYWRLIYSAALQAGLTEEEAQDVVQETVMTVAKNISQFDPGREHGSFKSWLLHTTRWRIADQFRKRPPSPVHVPSVEDSSSQTTTTERIADPATLNLDSLWEHEWEQNLIDAAIEKVKKTVKPDYYQMFDLHVLKQWPASKVAHRLGVALGRVYVAKYKITRQIKKEVKRLETKLV